MTHSIAASVRDQLDSLGLRAAVVVVDTLSASEGLADTQCDVAINTGISGAEMMSAASSLIDMVERGIRAKECPCEVCEMHLTALAGARAVLETRRGRAPDEPPETVN